MNEDNDNRECNKKNIELKIQYRKLLKEIEELQEELAKIENEQLLGYMIDSNELYRQVKDSEAAAIDAKIVNLCARILRLQSEQMSSNIIQFRSREYAERLLLQMDIDLGKKLNKTKLVMLGTKLKSKFLKSPTLKYMYSALDSTPPQAVPLKKHERAVPCRSSGKFKDLVETSCSLIRKVEKDESTTEELVVQVYRELIEKYKMNNRKALNYFEFVIDPNSFGNTIEHMFYVSFLIQEGKVAIFICENEGLPFIEPLNDFKSSNTNHDFMQVIVNFSVLDWTRLKETLNIKQSAMQLL